MLSFSIIAAIFPLIGAIWLGGWIGYWLIAKTLRQNAIQPNLRQISLFIVLSVGIASLVVLVGQYTLLGLCLLLTLFLGGWLLSWPIQQHYAGALLLDVGRTDHSKQIFWAGILLCIVVVISLVTTIPEILAQKGSEFSVSLPIVSTIFSSFVAIFLLRSGLSHLEFREKGVFFMGSVIPWKKMTSCKWEPSTPNILTIRVNPQMSIMPKLMSLVIPDTHKEAVGQLLQDKSIKCIMADYPLVWVMMGVAGAGKTVVGRRWAERLDCDFLEGDRRHSPENILKMRSQVPLDDGDRHQWLLDIEADIQNAIQHQREVVLTCSALKASYRRQLTALGRVQLVWLSVSRSELRRRLAQRSHHYMKPDMLDSQLDAFESIHPDETVITLDGEQPLDQMMDRLWAIAIQRFPSLQQDWWQRP